MTDPQRGATDQHDAHVLILGGSFTGVELVRLLRRDRRGRKLEIIVVDRQREHPYIPLGHELVTERMQPGEPGKTVLASDRFVEAKPPARWVQGEIVGFDPGSHTVTLADGRTLSGRFVVVALGSEVRPPSSMSGGERMLAYKFESDVWVGKDGQEVNGKSILGVLMLACGQGSKISLRVEGKDADKAHAALADLVSGGFGEI
jgi:phosphotransferase system HPr (HPr) family protein